LFHPLRVSDGDGTLQLEGTARFRPAPGQPRFDLALSSHAYPLSRLLQYLELDFPVEGKVTGDLRVSGTPPDAVVGGGPIDLAVGSLDRPDLKVTASLSGANFYGHPVPPNLEPRLDATVTRGVVDATAGVPERWTLKAGGDLFGTPARVEFSLDAKDLGAFLI